MLRLARWIIGYISFSFSNGFVEGFLNECYDAGINVYSLMKKDGSLYGECSARTYIKLRHIAKNNGGILHIIKKNGPLFLLLKLKNRWGLLFGVVASVLIICALSSFVWSINIVGNNKISQSDILLFLEENDVHTGVYSRSIDSDVIENLMMSSFDKCAWSHINIDGTSMTVEIDEAVEKNDPVDQKLITNVKAVKDGVIVKATTYDGWQMVQKGDSVTQGDLLISGVYESEVTKRNVFAHASGEILAKCVNDFSLVISRQQCKKQYTDIRQFSSLYFFGVKIPLYIGSSSFTDSDVEYDASYAMLNGKELPIGIVTKTVRRFSVEVNELSDKDLNILITDEMKKQIAHEYADAQIISQDVDIELNSNNAKAVGTITTIEQIGEEVRLKAKK